MCLAKMSAALNLSTVGKDNFPHRFNKQENNNYCGSYPDKHYYGYETMSDLTSGTMMSLMVFLTFRKNYTPMVEMMLFCKERIV